MRSAGQGETEGRIQIFTETAFERNSILLGRTTILSFNRLYNILV